MIANNNNNDPPKYLTDADITISLIILIGLIIGLLS